nr:immunoglobulin heavy chain junction region [Macaca mulatta]MOW19453.1 immunoglobulin heavy chain junction region [Macaca mulatta]MOW19525.1 immunoglobulin heavy chain junction region [Macaca mulatta]MOW19907.1 immunoglobulin heavy chain junction region [Macaca mulatta]MOW19952.1 immunoglobulin heavy chain junction region [Macaca mulatta]
CASKSYSGKYYEYFEFW